MITLAVADRAGIKWSQRQIARRHYLHKPVDVRSRPITYLVRLGRHNDPIVGCLVFGRPESTRCYDGGLTYGDRDDVADGKAALDYWQVLNLARVWLSSEVQPGGALYGPAFLPGYIDRRGVWHSVLASCVIGLALARVGYDYLYTHAPVDCQFPYQIRACLSYCDRRRHKGTIYRAAGFELARTNERNIETWWTPVVTPLTPEQDADIRRRAQLDPRSRRIRAERQVVQMEMSLC